MKKWLIAHTGENSYWLTRIDVLPNGREDYLCGWCDGPLVDSIVAMFESSQGGEGVVASSICSKCDSLAYAGESIPEELNTRVELLLRKEGTA